MDQEPPNAQPSASQQVTTATNKVLGAVDSTLSNNSSGLQQLDIPKTVSQYRQLRGMIGGVILVIASILFGLYFYHKNHQLKATVIIVAFGSVLGLIVFLLSLISYLQLKKARKNPTSFNQFQTSTAVKYSTAQPAAEATASEKVVNWFGPISRADWGATSYTILEKEVTRRAENTLLITNKQLIALMLGPQDVGTIQANSAVQNLVGKALEYSPESADAKNDQFRALNAAKWPDMVQSLLLRPLPAILADHLNIGIPYSAIESIEMRDKFINPGLTIHLKEGQKISYATFKRDRLAEIAATLQPYVHVQ